MNEFAVVIPARYASTRLPGKPLSDIHGVPMIVRVARQAHASAAREIVVAVDDMRVAQVLTAFGIAWEMTRSDHQSGSDRVMEVAQRRGWADADIVVNVQGDEPLIPPAVINQTAQLLNPQSGASVATLCEPITERALVFDPNVVKVVRSRSGRALYFSRAPIPWRRDDFAVDRVGDLPGGWWRHIGIYAYRVGALKEFCGFPARPTR